MSGIGVSLRGLWLLEGALSAQMRKVHLNYICISIHRCIIGLLNMIVNSVTPYELWRYSLFLPSSFCIYLSRPSLKRPPFSYFPDQITYIQLFYCLLLPKSSIIQSSCSTFLVSAVTPRFVLTSKDLELGVFNEGEHVILSFQVWLISINMIISTSVYYPAKFWFHFFLVLKHVPECVCIAP